MRIFILTGAILLLASAAIASPGVDQEVYDQGRNAVFEERWEDARAVFEDFTRRFPSSTLADDAQYWLGMAYYEMGDAERAYTVLKAMNARFPDSPWSDDARVLMVRCAESVLKAAGSGRGGASEAQGASPRVPSSRLAEYESFIERSTQDSSSTVQLLAIDTMLISKPAKASELLPRLSNGTASREATGIVLDRFFGGERVKVTIEDPDGGLTDTNVAVMVRDGDQVDYLTLTEAVGLVHQQGPRAGGPSYPPAVLDEIREKLVRTENNLAREGDPGTVETHPGGGGRSMSAIVKVVDGEVHYYRNGPEITRIVVLKRSAGFNASNIRIFVDDGSSVREVGLDEARANQGAASLRGLSEGTVRYLKAALAIIEIDLTRGAAGRP